MNMSSRASFDLFSSHPSAAWVSAEALSTRIDPPYYSADYLPLDTQLEDKPKDAVVPLRRLLVRPRRVLYMNTDTYDVTEKPSDAVPFISGVDLDPSTMGIAWDRVRYVHGWMAECYPKGLLFSGAMLVKVKGPHQHAIFVETCPTRALVSGTIFFASVKNVDPFYLESYLTSSIGYRWRTRLRTNITVEFVSNEELKQVPVFLPLPEVQKAIGNKVRKARRLLEMAERERSQLHESLECLLGNIPDHDRFANAYWANPASAHTTRLNPTEFDPYSLRVEKTIIEDYSGVSLRDALVSPDDVSGGATPLGAAYFEDGIGFLRVQNVKRNRIDRHDLVYVDASTDQELQRSRIQPQDVVMTITGYPGTACCIQAEELPLNMNQHSVRFHLSSKWNPFFVAAFLNSSWGQVQVTRRSIGATRDALDYPSVLSLVIPQVGQDVQDEIGDRAMRYATYWRESLELIDAARRHVDDIVVGDEQPMNALLAESHSLTQWLRDNQRRP